MSSGSFDNADSATLLSSVVDALTTALVVLDDRLRVVHLNSAAEQLLGISLNRALQRALSEVVPGNDGLQQLCAMRVATVRRELALTVVSGEERIVDCRVTPMDGATGADLLIELIDAEPGLQIHREVALLAQQSVSRGISRQLAHEIKNPLGGLRGAAQLLDRQLELPEQKTCTRIIIEEADRLTHLVDSMLGPHQPLQRRSQNVHELVQRVRTLLDNEAGGAVTIVEDYDPSLPELLLDRDAILQAFLNIGRNAIQALAGGGTLCLRTRAETQHVLRGQRHAVVARIDFEDDGPGVAAAVRDTLFYPLITARAGGTGLGLALSQELINRHGGLVQLRNAGDPTIFSVYLPA